jgi:hypothetical protein
MQIFDAPLAPSLYFLALEENRHLSSRFLKIIFNFLKNIASAFLKSVTQSAPLLLAYPPKLRASSHSFRCGGGRMDGT